MGAKIFVNYRRDDAKAEAARLHDKLALHFGAANVFMDVDNLLPGERFDIKLGEALAETDIFLAVIGARWQELLDARAASGERDYVREEIAAAIARKIVVIPVPMDRAPLPKFASLPEVIRELALYHKQDVAHESFGRDVAALIHAIEAHRGERTRKQTETALAAREKKEAVSSVRAQAERQARDEGRRERERQARRGDGIGVSWWLAFAAVVAGVLAGWLWSAGLEQRLPPVAATNALPEPGLHENLKERIARKLKGLSRTGE